VIQLRNGSRRRKLSNTPSQARLASGLAENASKPGGARGAAKDAANARLTRGIPPNHCGVCGACAGLCGASRLQCEWRAFCSRISFNKGPSRCLLLCRCSVTALLLLAGRGGRREKQGGVQGLNKVCSLAGHGGEGGTGLPSPAKFGASRASWCNLLKGSIALFLSLSGHGGEGRRRGDAVFLTRRRQLYLRWFFFKRNYGAGTMAAAIYSRQGGCFSTSVTEASPCPIGARRLLADK
jgi:hypothetical protein